MELIMENRIYDLIASWAGVSTWHTSHPLDQERFSIAMHNVIAELGSAVDIDAFENALRRHANSNLTLLGTPEHWDELIAKFIIKAEAIFTFEQARV